MKEMNFHDKNNPRGVRSNERLKVLLHEYKKEGVYWQDVYDEYKNLINILKEVSKNKFIPQGKKLKSIVEFFSETFLMAMVLTKVYLDSYEFDGIEEDIEDIFAFGQSISLYYSEKVWKEMRDLQLDKLDYIYSDEMGKNIYPKLANKFNLALVNLVVFLAKEYEEESPAGWMSSIHTSKNLEEIL